MQNVSNNPTGSVASPSPDIEFTRLILSISRTTRALMGLKLAELGLYSGQDELLLAIQGHGPFSVSSVAEQLNVRPSTVSKMLDRLAELGMLERIADSTDARRTLVQITPAGREMLDGVISLHESVEASIEKSLTNGRDAMVQALAEVDDLLAQRLRRLR